ncbi:MAG: GNAT family N-acetyltransferase [Pseudomonadota bacterium]
MLIRELDPTQDLAILTALQTEAQDFWHLADGHCDPAQKAAEFFTDGPPGCDLAQSHRLGLFHDGQLCGIAELSFGFPNLGDAYLGLMLLAPRLRSTGAGPILLAEVESRARAAQSRILYLAVLEANPRGRAFWHRMGFTPTGVTGHDADTGHILHRLAKPLT